MPTVLQATKPKIPVHTIKTELKIQQHVKVELPKALEIHNKPEKIDPIPAILKPTEPTESIKELTGELENSMTKIEAPSETHVDSESEDDNNQTTQKFVVPQVPVVE